MKPVLMLLMLLTFGMASAADKEPTFGGKTRAEWTAALADANTVATAVEAAGALGKLADPAASPALVAAARQHEAAEVRIAVVEALAAVGPKAAPHVIPLFRDPDDGLAVIAGLAASGWGPGGRAAAVPAVRLLARKLPHELRERVATWLTGTHNHDAVPALVELLKSEDPVSRLTAAHVLFHLEAEVKPAVNAVAAILKDLPEDRRARAVLNLGTAGTEAVPVLAEHLTDPAAVVRFAAAAALARLGPAAGRASDPLAKALAAEPDERVRLRLAEAAWRVARRKEAVAALAKLTVSAADEVAVAAAELLWHAGRDPKALAALARLAAGEAVPGDGAIRALGALADIGPPAAKLAADLVPLLDNPNRRAFAARTLGRIGYRDEAAAERLAKLAADEKSPAVRFYLTIAQAAVSGSEVPWKGLVGLLNDAPKADRADLARQLLWVVPPTKEGVDAIRELSKSEHAVVRVFAADLLVRGGRTTEAVPVLKALLGESDSEAVFQAALSLGLCGADGETAVVLLGGLLWDDRYAHTAAEALGRMGSAVARAVPLLIDRLRAGDGPPETYSSVCEALAEIGAAAKPAVDELRKQLRSPVAYVRVHAARALWTIAGDKAGEAELAAALSHHDHKCRGYAAEALWFLRADKQAIPTLLRMLDDFGPERGNQRYIAARALGRIGPAAKDAIPLLKVALDDHDPMLAATARQALARIGAPK